VKNRREKGYRACTRGKREEKKRKKKAKREEEEERVRGD
jgi:hypothetical protein